MCPADNVFLGEVGHVPELGALLWPRLAAAYIEARLAPALPEDDSDLAAFDRVRRAAIYLSSIYLRDKL